MSEEGAKKPRAKAGAKKIGRRKASKKTPEAPEETQQTEVGLGPAPLPMIPSRHDRETHQRQARGFSFGELSAAAVGLVFARDHDVMVDIRRRSVLDENVEKLKSWYIPPPTKPKVEAIGEAGEGKPKKKAAKPKKASRAAKAKEA